MISERGTPLSRGSFSEKEIIMSALLRRLLTAPIFAIALTLALCAPLAAIPRWTALGPFGGDVYALAVDPVDTRVLYANAGGNTFKSTNGGSTWIPVHVGSDGNVVVDPSRHTIIGSSFHRRTRRIIFQVSLRAGSQPTARSPAPPASPPG
jgi:hypothetical protein